jgi:hypothetical protein
MTAAITAPSPNAGGIEADHVNALAGRGELVHCGRERGRILRIDPSGQVQNGMAAAKRLSDESRRPCLGRKADRAQYAQDHATEHR